MKQKYEWKKTAMKAVGVFASGGIGALLAWLIGLEPTTTVVIVIALLRAAHNYLKHNEFPSILR